jgi:hypothetical protein
LEVATREWLIVITNITVILVGIKVILTIGEMKNKVDTMWEYFKINMSFGNNRHKNE